MKYAPRRTKDLTGRTYGLLTVLRRREERGHPDGSYRWDCLCECGNETVVRTSGLTTGRTKSCGCYKATMARRRGRRLTGAGYAELFAPDHPNARANGRVFEHTFVMSEALGRPLYPEETVHHINGQRADNRIENLELWDSSQPPGQRTAQKIQWARQYLESHGYNVKRPARRR